MGNKEEYNKELVSKLLKASEAINNAPKAAYVVIAPDTIKKIAEINNVSEEEATEMLKNYLNPNAK